MEWEIIVAMIPVMDTKEMSAAILIDS